MKRILKVLVLLLLCSAPAWATLGQPVATVSSDQARLHGKLQSTERMGYSIQQITAPDGAVVTEYVSNSGMVFGISWSAPVMPNLSQLMGSYFTQFQQAVQSQRSSHRLRAVTLRTNQLVVESSGHMRAFHGRAYVPGLIPSGVTEEVVQ